MFLALTNGWFLLQTARLLAKLKALIFSNSSFIKKVLCQFEDALLNK